MSQPPGRDLVDERVLVLHDFPRYVSGDEEEGRSWIMRRTVGFEGGGRIDALPGQDVVRAGGVQAPADSSVPAEIAPVDMDGVVNRDTLRLAQGLRLYHRHRVRGLENLTRALETDRPLVVVGNHCMDIVDPLMLGAAVYEQTGRVMRIIAHGKMFFSLPVLSSWVKGLGCVPHRHMAGADAVVRAREPLLIYPGGASEAIVRSYRNQPYKLSWSGRLGFLELALRHRARLLFVAGVGIDELYYQTRIPIPEFGIALTTGSPKRYRGARLGLGAAGLHLMPGCFPFPVRVTHVVSPPLDLDYGIDPTDRRALRKAHSKVWRRCQAYLRRAVAHRAEDSDVIDALLRRAQRGLAWMGL